MTQSRKKVFIALSGGVDSSVAAALLKERGFEVYGIHMKMWDPADAGKSEIRNPKSENEKPFNGVCRQQFQDRMDAMRVAATLDIPFQTWDFSEEYRKAVVEYMIREYAAGRTPNPDVMCNRRIKFGLFLEHALRADADFIATGHYVKRKPEFPIINSQFSNDASIPKFSNLKIGSLKNSLKIENCKLKIARDLNKDQSYFLWTLTQGQLAHCLFPIGEYTKPEVREMARRFGLPTAEKPDSQGVCFIGEISVRDFLKTYIPERRGRVLTTAGQMVGEHPGVEFFTIGQRHLGISGRPSAHQISQRADGRTPQQAGRPAQAGARSASAETRREPPAEGGGGIPYYVADKDLRTNTLVVGEGPYDGALFRRELAATDVNWISGRPPAGGFPLRCEARIRYRQPLQPCLVTQNNADNTQIGPDHLRASAFPSASICVVFEEPQRAVTPGQSIVFYQRKSLDSAQDIEMLGGAIIS